MTDLYDMAFKKACLKNFYVKSVNKDLTTLSYVFYGYVNNDPTRNHTIIIPEERIIGYVNNYNHRSINVYGKGYYAQNSFKFIEIHKIELAF